MDSHGQKMTFECRTILFIQKSRTLIDHSPIENGIHPMLIIVNQREQIEQRQKMRINANFSFLATLSISLKRTSVGEIRHWKQLIWIRAIFIFLQTVPWNTHVVEWKDIISTPLCMVVLFLLSFPINDENWHFNSIFVRRFSRKKHNVCPNHKTSRKYGGFYSIIPAFKEIIDTGKLRR